MAFWGFIGNGIALCGIHRVVDGPVPNSDGGGGWVAVTAPPAVVRLLCLCPKPDTAPAWLACLNGRHGQRVCPANVCHLNPDLPCSPPRGHLPGRCLHLSQMPKARRFLLIPISCASGAACLNHNSSPPRAFRSACRRTSGAVRPPREAGGAPTGARPTRTWAFNPIYHLNPNPLHLLPLYLLFIFFFFFFRNFLFKLQLPIYWRFRGRAMRPETSNFQ